jgi:pimeloyl-ACP methyl ester carboxylesterase
MLLMEKILMLGSNKNILTFALSPGGRSNSGGEKPTILLLNAGLLHRIGPFRFNVDLARSLSTLGYRTIRFDVSGIGDSALHRETKSYEDRIKTDIVEIMDYFQQKNGVQEYALIGLCAGAENAHIVASEDKRVIGVVMIDGFTYPTLLYYIIELAPVFLNPIRLCRAILKRIFKPFKKIQGSTEQSRIFVRTFPPRSKTAKELGEMAQRDVNILNIYSGQIAGYNYANQYHDMFKDVDFKNKMKLIYFKDADHTFSSMAERKRMMSCITDWLEDAFPSN